MKPSPYTVRYSPHEIDHYYRSGVWSADTFHDLLLRRVEENPDKVFATDGTRSSTPANAWLSVCTDVVCGAVTKPPCSCRTGWSSFRY
jgi:non-ribosomal peptide synthetase component E (peptide arylation enzyme)